MNGGWFTVYVFFTVFQLYLDNGTEIMKGCAQWNPVIDWKVLSLGLLEPTGLRDSRKLMKSMAIKVQH